MTTMKQTAAGLALLLAIATAPQGRGVYAAVAPAQTLYSFSLVKPGGAVTPLGAYKGKVVVVVNLASKSTFAAQLAALEKLQQEYGSKGLVVLGVPSNDFGQEEPGSDAEIQRVYADAHVTFPVFAKSAVCGKDALPVYHFLIAGARATTTKVPKEDEPVHWSFTKFIVTRDGQVGARFEPDVAPDSPEFQIAVERALDGKLKVIAKPAPGSGESSDDSGGDDDDGGR